MQSNVAHIYRIACAVENNNKNMIKDIIKYDVLTKTYSIKRDNLIDNSCCIF